VGQALKASILSPIVIDEDKKFHDIENKGGFVEYPSPTKVAQQTLTKIISPTFPNLVTPKAGAKHKLLFNKPACQCYFFLRRLI
jgi:hypothetical protein